MAQPWPHDDTDDTDPDMDYCVYCHSNPCHCDLTYELWRDTN